MARGGSVGKGSRDGGVRREAFGGAVNMVVGNAVNLVFETAPSVSSLLYVSEDPAEGERSRPVWFFDMSVW